MKKLLSLVMVFLLGAGVSAAYGKQKKAAVSLPDKPVTVIVMDSTNALLDGVQVRICKKVFQTSYDGRVVIKPSELKGAKSLTASRDGYVSKTESLNGKEVIIVTLQKKYCKEEQANHRDLHAVGSGRAGKGTPMSEPDVYYSMRAATKDEEAYMDAAMVSMPGEGGHASNSVSAGKLTAGEVNDFAKWYLWPNIFSGSHKDYPTRWNIAPWYRYTVQVMTRSGSPVASRAVSLLDAKGNTLFQAVTDNTGKAELWHQLIIANCQEANSDGLQIRVDNQTKSASPWNEKVETFVLDEDCDMSDAVDVVFVFDATGSMGDELHYLQAEMKDVIARASQATGGLKIRTGAVVYRDHGDTYLTRISRLTDDITTTQAFIDKQSANGGGDFPEAIPEALMAALNSSGWDSNARARIAFLVLDAPCHQDSTTLALLHDQVLNAAAQGVRIVPVVCSGLQESGEYLMRAIALATNGTSFFLTDDSGIGHTHLKPTTDSLKVEHLNDMLVRTIVEFSTMPACEALADEEELNSNEQFIPNPFSTENLAADPTIPHGEGVHYLVDVTGKLLGVFEGEVKTDFLPIGAYFIKTYVDGQWYTKKIFISRF